MDLHNLRDTLSVLDADLSNSRFDDVSLAGATFERINLTGATFENGRMSNITCTDVNLAGSKFVNVNLSRVALDDVNLTGASITNATLLDMTIDGVLASDLLRAYRAPTRSRAVLYVCDAERVRPFYERVLGFRVERDGDGFVVLGSSELRLVMVTIPAAIAESITITAPPQRREDTPIKMSLAVTSIAAARAAAPSVGAEVLPASREWGFDGERVCDAIDAEGNVIELRETIAG